MSTQSRQQAFDQRLMDIGYDVHRNGIFLCVYKDGHLLISGIQPVGKRPAPKAFRRPMETCERW